MELMAAVHAKITAEGLARLRSDIEDVWLRREVQAFRVSIKVAGFIQHVIAAKERLERIGAASPIKDDEFAAGLLLEYLGLAEGIFKLQLCHIAILSVYAGNTVNIRGVSSPRSHGELIRANIYVEDLVSVAREAGFAAVVDRVFSNPIRRAIAHMDLNIGPSGKVTFYETDREGSRTQLGPPESIADLQARNFALRDFAHSMSGAMKSYAAGTSGFGVAG